MSVFNIIRKEKVMYIIKSITGKNGLERTDGRYPLRKGCTGNIYYLNSGDVVIFEYIKDNEGNDKSGYLRTSTVDDYEEYENGVIVYTLNSVYYLQKVEDE